ncbi:MAG: cytochrome c [Deltaproteobacteria bacterium]|nr:cytochrome c [Deltaproteobacteria bacterium]
MATIATSLAFLSALSLAPSHADESTFRLKNANGRDLVATKCITCHSLDYIPMNSKFLDRKGWDAEVRKMIKAMGAPINPDEAATIVEYLSKNYGRDNPPD